MNILNIQLIQLQFKLKYFSTAVKGVARNTKKLSQQDVALQVHNTKRKDSSKVKAKTKEKIEPAQSRAVKRTDASGRDMDKHKRHRLANMLKPFEIQVRQLLTNRGVRS